MICPAEPDRRGLRVDALHARSLDPAPRTPYAAALPRATQRIRLALGACAVAVLAACNSATCPSGRVSGTGACNTTNASTADDNDGGEPATGPIDKPDEDAGPQPLAADGGAKTTPRAGAS